MEQIVKKYKKIFACIFLFIVIFSFLGSCCKAEINGDYGYNNEVYSSDLEKKANESILWNAIAQLIYGVGNIIEHLTGVAMGQLTGKNVFPWADRVIFNTMPMLDINFLSPSSGSMFLSNPKNANEEPKELILSKIVKNVYYTILTLSVGFLGVAVGIMAIRLAISSIAAEKAKYKEAIMNWLLGIVMLFTMHFILSFIFYANEQMVKIASNILNNSLDGIEINPINNKESYFKIVDICLEKIKNDVDKQGADHGGAARNSPTFIDADASSKAKIYQSRDYSSENCEHAGDVYNKVEEMLKNDRNKIMLGKMLSNSRYREIQLFFAPGQSYDGDWWDNIGSSFDGNKGKGAIRTIYNDLYIIQDPSRLIDPSSYYTSDTPQTKDWKNQVNKISEVYQILDSVNKSTPNDGTVGENSTYATQLIADMGIYFKNSAWTYDSDSNGNAKNWIPNKITLTGATLYSIFIIQSLIYFVQYIKRFFYVIILSLMGPIVVIYDFITKTAR